MVTIIKKALFILNLSAILPISALQHGIKHNQKEVEEEPIKETFLESELKAIYKTHKETMKCFDAINQLSFVTQMQINISCGNFLKSQGYSQLGAMNNVGELARRAMLLNHVLHEGLHVKGLQEISEEGPQIFPSRKDRAVFLRNYIEKEKVHAEKYNYPIISPLLMKVTGSDEAFIPWFTTLQKEQMIIRDSLAACLTVARQGSRPSLFSRL